MDQFSSFVIRASSFPKICCPQKTSHNRTHLRRRPCRPPYRLRFGSRQPTDVETVGVLHLINGEHYAGAERVQDLLAQRLPEFGFRVGFACVKLKAFDAMRESRDAPLYDVPMWTRFDLTAAVRVARILRCGDYRILHAHTVRTALVGSLAAAMAGVPMVYHAHSPTTHNTSDGWRDWVNGIVERRSLRRAARVIAVSRAIADHIAAEGYDLDRIVVVPNGVPQVAATAGSAEARRMLDAGSCGPVPAAQGNRGPVGGHCHPAEPRSAGALAGGGDIRVARISGRNRRPRRAAPTRPSTSPGPASPAT